MDPLYWCYLVLGSATLLPWNALITAADYWESRFKGMHTDRLLTISYLPCNLVVIAAMVHWHARVHPRLRILGGLAGYTLAVAAVPLLDLAPAAPATLGALLALVAACGACDGFAQGALFGEAALLPPKYTQALVGGTAISGVAVSLLRVLTKATLPDTEAGLRRSANLYFALTALVCASSTAVYAWAVPRLMQAHRQAALDAALHAGSDDEELAAGPAWKLLAQHPEAPAADVELSAVGAHPHTNGGAVDWQQGEQQREQRQRQQQELGAHEQQAFARQALLPGQQGPLGSSSSPGWLQPGPARHGAPPRSWAADGGLAGPASGLEVFQLIWRLAVSNMLIYVVTLAIFPGVLAEDVHSAELGSWFPVALIAAYNLADGAGKLAPGAPSLRLRNERVILGAVLLRALFIPAFHVAAVSGGGPVVLTALTLLLGGSNGWLTACAMIEGAAAAPPAAAELAGNIMVLFLIVGLCIGAACGFLWLL